ncbi:HotDog domain-containing protein [Chytridium lagenaria]|nr:HotDog domain-containing protein [Chytridium lagenaria]
MGDLVSFKTLKTREERIAFVENTISSLRNFGAGDHRWDDTIYDNLKVVDAEFGKVQFHYTVAKSHTNPRGFLHGGAAATIIDVCSSLSIFTVELDGFSGVSTDLTVNFTAAAPADQTLLVVAEVTHHGRLLDFTSTVIYSMDSEGKPKKQVARGLHTKFVVKSKM